MRVRASPPSVPTRPILLSIVIPTWNAAELTATTLEELVRDGVPVWAEIIVVDDGSDDGTAGEISERFPQILVLRHEHNRRTRTWRPPNSSLRRPLTRSTAVRSL